MTRFIYNCSQPSLQRHSLQQQNSYNVILIRTELNYCSKSEFFITAKCLETNDVVVKRVLCICLETVFSYAGIELV